MTIRVREQLATGDGSGDRGGRRNRRREFVVNNVLPESIPIAPGLPPIVDEVDGQILPVPGMPHPGDPFLLADVVDPRALLDARGSRVTVLYSATGQFKQPDLVLPEDVADFAAPSFTNVDVEREIPINYYVEKTQPNDPDSPVGTFWEIRKQLVVETAEIVRVRVSVHKDSLRASIRQVRAQLRSQSNKVHTLPGGDKGLFRSPQAHPDGSFVVFDYEWELDEGTPEDSVRFNGSVDVVPPLNVNVDPRPQNGFVRDPFHALKTFPSNNPTDRVDGFHKWIQVRQYPERPQGFQGLPGNPGALL